MRITDEGLEDKLLNYDFITKSKMYHFIDPMVEVAETNKLPIDSDKFKMRMKHIVDEFYRRNAKKILTLNSSVKNFYRKQIKKGVVISIENGLLEECSIESVLVSKSKEELQEELRNIADISFIDKIDLESYTVYIDLQEIELVVSKFRSDDNTYFHIGYMSETSEFQTILLHYKNKEGVVEFKNAICTCSVVCSKLKGCECRKVIDTNVDCYYGKIVLGTIVLLEEVDMILKEMGYRYLKEEIIIGVNRGVCTKIKCVQADED